MKIGIFGGAFDPPHEGHARAAREAFDFLRLDLLFVVPAYLAPLKNEPAAGARHRFNMCRLAFSGENSVKKIQVSDIEIAKGKISYTEETVKHFLTLYPKAELFLILGDDQIEKLHLWKNPRYLAENVTFAVLKRQDKETPPVCGVPGARVVTVETAVTEVSSTEIRRGEKQELLNDKVREYIKQNGLYRHA